MARGFGEVPVRIIQLFEAVVGAPYLELFVPSAFREKQLCNIAVERGVQEHKRTQEECDPSYEGTLFARFGLCILYYDDVIPSE